LFGEFTMTARVRGVIAPSMAATSRSNVLGSTFTDTAFAPTARMSAS